MNELNHYGVKGMKWGHRKQRPISVRERSKRARAAGADAYRKTTIENGGKLYGKKNPVLAKHPSLAAKGKARKAYDAAKKESLQESTAYNKQLRAKKKAEKKAIREDYWKLQKATGVYDIDYNERGEAVSVRNRRIETLATMQKEKGRAHVERVLKKEKDVQKATVAAVAGTYAVGIGIAVVGSMLDY